MHPRHDTAERFYGIHCLVRSGPLRLGGMRNLITAGGSTVSSTAYVTAAAAPDGTLLVAYIPPAHSGSITVDMGAMSGPSQARWFDPTSAAYIGIGTGLPNTGTRIFTPLETTVSVKAIGS